MSDLKHHIYLFEAVRPELITDEDAWTEDDLQTAKEHFAYLKKATDEGRVILAGRSTDGIGPAIVIVDTATSSGFFNRMRFTAEGGFLLIM